MIDHALTQKNSHMSTFVNNCLTDLKNLTNSLKPLSKTSAEINNSIINKLLLANDRDSLSIIKDILQHLLHIVQLKGLNTSIIGILTKIIAFVKIIDDQQHKNEEKLFAAVIYQSSMTQIFFNVIDIIFVLKNKYKETEFILRIIQTTFSLIDIKLIKFANQNAFTRLYSICFDCSLTNSIIQNISTSALFALTEVIFINQTTADSISILIQFLQFLFNNKKYAWIKDGQFKGIVWDLVVIAIKNYPIRQIASIASNTTLIALLNHMYKLCIQTIFNPESNKTNLSNKKTNKKDNDKIMGFKKNSFSDFIRFYKCYIYLSIQFSIKLTGFSKELIPFRQNLNLFKIFNEYQRGNNLYIIVQGISILLTEGHFLLIEDDKFIILLDVFGKIIEELCLNHSPVDLHSQTKDICLEKMCGDFPKIIDSDFAKIMKNTIIKLRKNFQKYIENKASEDELKSQRSQISQKESENGRPLSEKKKWERLIITVVNIIRYLTSLNMQWGQNEQLVRKLIIELQYWFLICPSNKTRNYIILQLFNTSTLIDTKMQAIKVSQCTQIGSNIIYGYYDILDSYGLTIILKMMAGVKTNWQDGKGFQELDQVCSMSQKLYMEQRLVRNQNSFAKTIQSFVQCANSLLADLQQPQKKQQKFKRIGKSPEDRFFKMIDYIFSKLKIILEQNLEYILNEWNFLTGFWISFCSNKVLQIKIKTMAHIGEVIPIILKKSQIRQQLIFSTYIELSKLHILDISKLILVHIKSFLLSINSEEAIIQIFRVIKIILQHKKYHSFQEEIFQLQEMLIKQSLFKIKSPKNIVFIIESMTFLSGDKNWEYKTVNLVWSISDHLKTMSKNNELAEIQFVWRKLFTKIQMLAINSIHGQTKQSCIHTFTQIIAQLSHIFSKDLFFLILKDIYLQLFYILLGISQRQKHVENIAQAEMMKIGIKNTLRIFKKCISEDKQKSEQLINLLNQKILFYLKQKQANITLQYCFELCSILQFLVSINKSETQKIIINISLVLQILEELSSFHVKFDKASLMWRKKYEPLYLGIKKYFTQL